MTPHLDVPNILRRIFEYAQDVIVAVLCVILLAVMVSSLWTLGRSTFVEMGQLAEVPSQIALVLVLIELFRSLIYYLTEHRVSVKLMLEVAIVSEIRAILLYPASAFGTRIYGDALLLAVLGTLLYFYSRPRPNRPAVE
jgi:uncharacterized membrane protein (DUF373 family)